MVNLLLGQTSSGYTKYPYFSYVWDSRNKRDHWSRKGENSVISGCNVINTVLVDRSLRC